MKILADENIPYAKQAFGALGDVFLAPGREITNSSLTDVEILIVRSITQVNQELLAGSKVRFVGTATAGVDHIDQDYVQKKGIEFASAAGCNANSVAEYMTAAWLGLATKYNFSLEGLSLGIVGVGHVGSQVERKARALGMRPVLNDPPKARQTGDSKYRPLSELQDCDIITCHTPLTKLGPDGTWHLIGEDFFAGLKPGAIICNAARGGVVDEKALKQAMTEKKFKAVVLDVWENEPRLDKALLEMVDLGTSHIAGYSLEGKVNGTRMIYQSMCEFLEVKSEWDVIVTLPEPDIECLKISSNARTDESILHEAVSSIYSIADDDMKLRSVCSVPMEHRVIAFDKLRKQYEVRREFSNTQLDIVDGNKRLKKMALGIGFQVL